MRILSKRSTYVYINISHVRNVVEIWLPTVSIQKLGSHSKFFSLQKKSLISFQKQTQSRKTADPKIGVPMLASLATHLFSLEQRGECDPVQPSNGWGVGSRIGKGQKPSSRKASKVSEKYGRENWQVGREKFTTTQKWSEKPTSPTLVWGVRAHINYVADVLKVLTVCSKTSQHTKPKPRAFSVLCQTWKLSLKN